MPYMQLPALKTTILPKLFFIYVYIYKACNISKEHTGCGICFPINIPQHRKHFPYLYFHFHFLSCFWPFHVKQVLHINQWEFLKSLSFGYHLKKKLKINIEWRYTHIYIIIYIFIYFSYFLKIYIFSLGILADRVRPLPYFWKPSPPRSPLCFFLLLFFLMLIFI